MRLSEAQSSYLAHRAVEAIKQSGGKLRNERLALTEVKKVLARTLDQDSHIDGVVRRRIASLSRRVPEGSAEYDVLYRQYFEQERRKQSR
jgi:hypothetical protein